MKYRKLFSIAFPIACLIVYITLTSYSGGSGIPVTGCGGGCHGNSATPATLITLSGLPAAGYVNGTTYTLTLTVNNPSIVPIGPFGLRDGFIMTASAGAFTAIPGTVSSPATQIRHTTPKAAPGGFCSWTFNWQAPASGSANINFNAACNATNGNGSPGSEDKWNLFSTTLVKAAPPASVLNLTMMLQGYYEENSSMRPVLLNQGQGSSSTNVDTIQVTLHNANFPFAQFATTTAILQTNGQAVATFSSITGSYYVRVDHRNALQTWSANPVSIIAGANSYNFSNAANKAYGNNMIEVEPGVWAIYSGDVAQDDNLDLLDISQVEADISTFQFGFFATDVNGDGNVDLLDTPALENNIANFVFSQHP